MSCVIILHLQCFEPWFAMCMIGMVTTQRYSYIGECWSNLKRNRVLEKPLRVDACIQSSKLYHTKGLCTPWTMKSSQGPVKSWDHFGLHEGQNARVTMEFEIPKRHSLRPTLFSYVVWWILRWERQKRHSSREKQGPMAKKCCYNKL
jgi:hypothetical protein